MEGFSWGLAEKLVYRLMTYDPLPILVSKRVFWDIQTECKEREGWKPHPPLGQATGFHLQFRHLHLATERSGRRVDGNPAVSHALGEL